MLQGQGMGLKRRMPVGLGRIPGMPGLGSQAQISDLQLLHHLPQALEPGEMVLGIYRGMNKDEPQERQVDQDESPEDIGLSHKLQ